jgi:hypothetical protein
MSVRTPILTTSSETCADAGAAVTTAAARIMLARIKLLANIALFPPHGGSAESWPRSHPFGLHSFDHSAGAVNAKTLHLEKQRA